MPKHPDIEKLWERLWAKFYDVDDREWPKQVHRLREMARQCEDLAALCDQLSTKAEISGQKATP